MVAPGAAYDMSNWSLTLPSGGTGTATVITQPTLATYTDAAFLVDAAGLLNFVAPANGPGTTSGSTSARSELGEQENGALAGFDMRTTQRRRLTVSGYFDPTSITGGSAPSQQQIIGQCHGTTGTPPVYMRIDYDHNPSRMRLFVNGPGYFDILTGMVPTDLLSYRFEILNGVFYVSAAVGNENLLPALPQCAFNVAALTDNVGCFLKVGAYNITDVSSGSSGNAISKLSFIELLRGQQPTGNSSPTPSRNAVGQSHCPILTLRIYVVQCRMARISALLIVAFLIGAAAASVFVMGLELSLPGTSVVSTRNLDNSYTVQRDAGLPKDSPYVGTGNGGGSVQP
jgi:hypothetical protein